MNLKERTLVSSKYSNINHEDNTRHEDNTKHQSQLKQLDDVIRTEFIPAITRGISCSDTEKRLMSWNSNIFRVSAKEIRLLGHTIKGFNNKHTATTFRNLQQCKNDQKQNKINQNATSQ